MLTKPTEETKPVEREANPDEQRRRDEQWGRQVASLADYNAGWDAALERAAQLELNEAMVPQDADSAHIYRVGFADCLNAILALKGSR